MPYTIHADLGLEKILKNEPKRLQDDDRFAIASAPLQAMQADLSSMLDLPAAKTDPTFHIQRLEGPKKIPKFDDINTMKADAPDLFKDLCRLTDKGVTPA